MSSLTIERTVEPQVTGRTVDRVWFDPTLAIAGAAVLVVIAGVVTGWLTPRGPLTTFSALLSMIAALGIGMAVGAATGSRWSILWVPLLYALTFEVVRISAAGPTVDAIALNTIIGQMVFAVGRAVHGILVLLPLALGAGWGVWLAQRLGHPTAVEPGWAGRVAFGLATLVVVVVGVSIARPASTAAITGPDGEPLAGSIAELVTVEIGGVDQVMLIRGRSVDNPVLLHLAGGPGGTDIGAMRDDTGLEQDFVVVTWDQRGTGKSYATSIDPVEDLSLEQAIRDTIEVSEYLRDRFDEEQIVLTANSWGTIPSVFAVDRRPELYRAYVGTGQMVNNRLTDQMFYEDTLAWAQETGREGLAESIREAGPPPYDDLTRYQYTAGYEHEWNDYPGVDALDEMPFNTFVPENTWMDRINAARGMFDVNWFVYPELQDYDFRRDVPELAVPVWIVLGEYEARGRDVLARDWFAALQAPAKELVVFEGAGHRPSFERPGEFARLMEEVLDQTSDAGPGR